jgi:hypothetical protein
MIYTCYEMVRDCRANRPEGWSHFVSNYMPVVRKLLTHYRGGEPATPFEAWFPNLEPGPERPFLAELRQKVLAGVNWAHPQVTIDLEAVAGALAPLTTVEKQAVWLETMAYGPVETAAMLRMAPTTIEKIRERASELLRAAVDTWSRSVLRDNGLALGREAAAGRTPDCVSGRVFLDVQDGRTTWQGRNEMERHLGACWHCIDHYCRLVEVIELLRHNQPLSPAETEAFLLAARRAGSSGAGGR